jgi:hypothetical protein
MSKVQREAQILKRYGFIKPTIPPLKPMKWKRKVGFDSTGLTPSMLSNA